MFLLLTRLIPYLFLNVGILDKIGESQYVDEPEAFFEGEDWKTRYRKAEVGNGVQGTFAHNTIYTRKLIDQCTVCLLFSVHPY